MRKQQATEYMYASARLSALENRMVGRERINALLEAKGRTEVMAKLHEFGEAYRLSLPTDGAGIDGNAVSVATEEMLSGLLKTAFAEVNEAVPDATVYRHFAYPYDCNNVKALLKCSIRGADPEGILFDFGSVSAEALQTAVREGKYDLLPPAMAQGVAEAKEAYAKTGDPQLIDAILDRACYADMLASAEASGSEVLLRWVKTKIDLVNVMICLRILRMKRGDTGKRFMNQALLSGGYLDQSFFETAYASGEDALWQGLVGRYYSFTKAAHATDLSLSAVEKCADDYYMRVVREDARVPFGVEIAGGYLIGCETAVKNIRIILAGKDAGLSADVIRERVRESYV